jgi:hypothetical protein
VRPSGSLTSSQWNKSKFSGVFTFIVFNFFVYRKCAIFFCMYVFQKIDKYFQQGKTVIRQLFDLLHINQALNIKRIDK